MKDDMRYEFVIPGLTRNQALPFDSRYFGTVNVAHIERESVHNGEFSK